jgi:hypothetical protein
MKTRAVPVPLSPHEIRFLAVAARRDPRTVVNAYHGTATPLARDAVAEAARVHNLPEPPLAA